MDLKREQIVDVLFTTAIVGVGVLIGNPVMTGVVGGIGAELAADLTQKGWGHVRQRLLGESGVLNHDLQQALVRAFRQTIAHLEQDWWKTTRGVQMKRSEPEAARVADEAFKLLREDADKFCTPDGLGRAAGNEQVQQLLYGDETAGRQAFSACLSGYLYGHDSQLVAFIEAHLVEELAFWFGEDLKADRPESNRAWRVFQRLLLLGLQAGLGEVEAAQQEIKLVLNDLTAWTQRMEARLPEERESTGQVALEQTLVDARSQIIDAIALESGRTRLAVEDGIDQIALLMRQELSMLRQQLLSYRPEIRSPPEPNRPPEIPGFVGRDAEIDYFRHKLETSHLAVITGMAGVGKTVLAAVLARQVADPDKTFWHSFHEGEGIHAIIWKLAAFLARHGEEDLWRMLHSTSQSDDQTRPREMLLDYLIQLIGGQGYLLCFDDFHHVDNFVDDAPLLESFVQRLRTEVPADELSIIIASRRMPVFVSVEEFDELKGLSPDDARRLLAERGVSLSDDLIDRLHDSTEGNAKLLTLAVNALRRSTNPARLISRLAKTRNITRYLMTHVDEGLSQDERDVMRAVSMLLDYPGTAGAIEAILGEDEIEMWDALTNLSELYLLTMEDGEAGWQYGQHAIVQDFYYNRLNRERRQAMHRRAGEYYEAEEPDALKAARHFERAGEYERATQLATADLWLTINQGQALALRRLLERFTAQQLDTAQWANVNIARAQLYALLREGQPARDSYQEALSQLAALDDSPAVRILRGRACRGMVDLLRYESPQEALEWLRRGLDEVAGASTLEEAALHIRVGHVQINMGEYDAALCELEQGLDLLPEEPSQMRAIALLNLGIIYCIRGDVERGRDYYLRALKISEKLHDYWRMVDIWMNLGIETDIAGNWDDAIVEYGKALAMAKQLGSVRQQAALELALGNVTTKQGDYQSAEMHLSNCVKMARDHKLREHHIAGLSSLAHLHLHRREPEAASSLLSEAERLALEMDAKDQLPEIYRGWAQVRRAEEQLQEALGYAERSVNLARGLGLDLEEGMSLRVLGQALLASGQHQPALAAFEQSLSLLADRDPHEAARTKTQWGLALVPGGEADQGTTLLQEARSTFQRLGAKRDLAAVDEVLHSNN